MSIEIQGAKQSPRYEDKIWYWYYGNTFTLSWKLLLKVNGIPMDIKDTDYVTFTFAYLILHKKFLKNSDLVIIHFV